MLNGNLAKRKKEVIEKCVDKFVEQGLYETTTRNLSDSINLQSGGIYQYFKSKDEMIIACAEEAAIRLEKELIMPIMNDVDDPEQLIEKLHFRADKMAATMRFFVQVCSSNKYRKSMAPAIERLSKRYEHYAEEFARKLGCDVDEIKPYVYLAITVVSNYMIFGEENYTAPQIDIIKEKIIQIIKQM